MIKNKKRLNIFNISLILLLILFAVPVLAAGGGGGGGGKDNGSGEGNTSLSLVSSEPKAGAKNIPADAQIKLTFSKNVVNMQVKDNNLKCFSMQDSKGQTVPIDILMADDQMEPEKKNDVIIVPKQSLAGGETYTIVISPELTGKNGLKMDKETKISISTVAEKGSSFILPIAFVAVILVGGFIYYKNQKK